MEHIVDGLPEKTFTCCLCGLSSSFTYHGQKPPNTKAIVLLEKCYIAKDPFTPEKERFLIIGSSCSLCNNIVCVGPLCSLFYTKRFCVPCVNKHLDQFPHQIQNELVKRTASSKTSVS